MSSEKIKGVNLNGLLNGFYVFAYALNYKITGKRVPIMVSLGITNKCNIKCIFCYAMDFENASIDYPTEKIFKYIDQFTELGTRIFLLQGGEPLLRKDLKEIITYIKKKNRYCRISTNGMLVAKKIDSLVDIDQISFSLDGNEEIVTKTRGKGVYEKVIEGMEAAYERRIPFEIHASLIRDAAQNKDSIFHILDLANRFNVYASFCITCVSGAENTESVGSGEMTGEEIKSFIRFMIKLKKEGYPISNSINSLKKTLNWPTHHSLIGYAHNLPSDFKFTQCRHGRLICWIDGNDMI